MEESKTRQILIEQPMDYTVIVPIRSYKFGNEPALNAHKWCDDNIRGEWSATHEPRLEIIETRVACLYDPTLPHDIFRQSTGRFTFTFRFEREEDAALFKLFWSEGVG